MFDWLGTYSFAADIILINALVVLSVFVVLQCGLLSLASVGFMAVGAYTSALLVTKQGWPVPAGILAGLVAGTLVALVFGPILLRLQGVYLALGSLALARIIAVGIANFEFTNGARGVFPIPGGITTEHIFGVLVVAGVVFQLIHRSRVGRAMRAMALDERTAQGLGIHALRYKVVAFAASGALAGTAGALEAHRVGVIAPEQYSFGLLVVVLTYAMIGGSGHWLGPILATLAIGALKEYFDWAGTFWEDIIYGSILIGMMILAPKGLSDRAIWRFLRRRSAPKVHVEATSEVVPAQ